MRVIPVKQPRKQRHPGRWIAGGLLAVFLAVISAGAVNYLRPLPLIEASAVTEKTVPAGQLSLAWPAYGQASVGLSDGTVLATHGAQLPLATASIAKVITALSVLDKYPLKPGETGPSLTITANDVAIYNQYVANGGSVTPIELGEKLTEYQILEALMIPSANNLADTAAIWAYGSLDAYLVYANQFLSRNGMANTKVAVDASGLSSATASTATDLIKLGSLAMKQPVLMEIASKKSTTLPLAGEVTNYNFALGQAGITGLKTGNNDQNLGALLFTADVPTANGTTQITGAVMGANSLSQALRDSVTFVSSVGDNFSTVPLAHKGQVVATYTAPWGASTTAVTTDALSVTRWNDQEATTHTELSPVNMNAPQEPVGTMYGRAARTQSQTTVVLEKPLAEPSFWWRLTRH